MVEIRRLQVEEASGEGLRRVAAALDGLEMMMPHGRRRYASYARQVAEEAEDAACPEVAMLARMIAIGGGKSEPEAMVHLARKALSHRLEHLGMEAGLAEDMAGAGPRPSDR